MELTPQQIQDLQNLKNKLDNGHVVVDAKQLDTIVTERANLLAAIGSLKPILDLVKPKPGEQVNLMAVIGNIMPQLPTLMPKIETAFKPVEHLLTELATDKQG